MNRVIKWEKFRSVLNQGCRKEDTGKGGRPPYDVVMMFKILVLQQLYNLSDDQTEYQTSLTSLVVDLNALTLQSTTPHCTI